MIKMTKREKAQLKRWNARLAAEGLSMKAGLPPGDIKLVSFDEQKHSPIQRVDDDE